MGLWVDEGGWGLRAAEVNIGGSGGRFGDPNHRNLIFFNYVHAMGKRLDESTFDHLRSIGISKHLRNGEALFHQGQRTDAVYLVASGRLRIVLATPTGQELLFAQKGRGELVGEMACLDQRERTATATSSGESEVIALGAERFLEALAQHGALAVEILRTVSAQLRQTDQRLALLTSADTGTRLARQLVELCQTFAEYNGDVDDIELLVSQDDLASWIGSTRESVARSLSSMRAAGVITTGRGRVEVHDLAALRVAGTEAG